VEHPDIIARDNTEPELSPARFIVDLNNTAAYVLTRSAPFFFFKHFLFLVAYVKKWLEADTEPERPPIAQEVAKTLLRRAPKWSRALLTRLLQRRKIPVEIQLSILLSPLLIPAVTIMPWEFARSGAFSALNVIRKGVRSLPPLITAVVVVFVTSDAWRILGTGFTPRFFGLVGAFLLAALALLIRFNDYWEYDIAASEDQAHTLLRGIRNKHQLKFREFIDRGACPAPMVRPTGLGGRALVYFAYAGLSAFSLIVAAMFVASALIFIGLILIDAKETKALAGSVHIYRALSSALPGDAVITRQLVSLSLCLGAFSAFFLVAAQRTEDRRTFMDNVLVRLRRALLVYSVYCRAHDCAQEWTGILVAAPRLSQAAQEDDDIQEAAAKIARRPGGLLGYRPLRPAVQARSSAISWTRESATAGELEYVAHYAGSADEFRAPDSMLDPLTPSSAAIADRYINYPGRSDWTAFQTAAQEVWAAVEPLQHPGPAERATAWWLAQAGPDLR